MTTKLLRVGILTPLRSLDPRDARETVSTMAVTQIYESLCRLPKGDGAAEPLLLTGLAAEGPSTWSGTVLQGVLFSDGTPLTPALAAAALGRSEVVSEQASVEAQGDRIVFQLKTPNPRFDLTLTLHQSAITLEKRGNLLGTGPFVPAPGSTIEALRLVRNPHYRGRPAIDEIEFKVYPPNPDGRPEALLKALAEGEVDFTNMLSRTDAAGVSGLRKQFHPANATAILFFNTERPELASPIARRALALAVNRLAVTEISYTNALAFAASGLLPPLMGSMRDELAHDVARARALFEQVPDPKPSRLKLVTVWAPRPYLPNPQPVAELVAKQLAALGVEVSVVVPSSSDDFYRSCVRAEYDLLLGGWVADTPDPVDFLEALLRSDRIQTQAAASLPRANRARFRSPEMDAALKRFREQPGPSESAAIAKLLTEQVPLVPLMYGPSVVVSSWKLNNVAVTSMGIPLFADADLAP